MDALVAEPVAALIFAVAQALGGNVGAAVIAVSVTVRLLMLPLSLKLAQRSWVHRQAMERLKPELDKLRRRFARKPRRLAEASAELFESHGLQPIETSTFKGALLQAPIFLALWSAVRRVSEAGGRFLWIGDLARPDAWLALIAALITGVGASAAALEGQEVPKLMTALPAVLTLIFLWKASAGVGLYWASSSMVGAIQGQWMRRWVERQQKFP